MASGAAGEGPNTAAAGIPWAGMEKGLQPVACNGPVILVMVVFSAAVLLVEDVVAAASALGATSAALASLAACV